MTSWISSNQQKKKVAPAPVSYFSYKEGTFSKRAGSATLVTAFYAIPSKQSVEVRFQRMQNFLQEFQCNVVLFTEHSFADEFALSRMGLESKTRIVVLDPEEWVANTKFIPALWQQQVKQDPELRLARTIEEFTFGFEKKEFVKKAIQMDPFQSTDFVWVDPFFVESEGRPPYTLGFPNLQRIPTDRILIANPEPFTADDIASSYFRGKNRISKSLLAGSKQAWIELGKTIDTVISEKLKISGFIGDDLLVLHYAVIHKPNQFSLVNESSLFAFLSN